MKVFIHGECGGNQNNDHAVIFTFSTIKDKIKFQMHPYGQNAWSSNSDNTSLLLDDTRKIHVKIDGKKWSGHLSVSLTILGYM